jgi:holo-[acyl-carrier protein] synthase
MGMNVVGLGIDIVEVARIRQLIERHGSRFLDRCFTLPEQKYASLSIRRSTEHLAARFAGKEAVLKALGTGLSGGICWTDIEITNAESGAPKLSLSGSASEAAARISASRWLISLSHTEQLAMASVIALSAIST